MLFVHVIKLIQGDMESSSGLVEPSSNAFPSLAGPYLL
jgi:hypothetical protein